MGTANQIFWAGSSGLLLVPRGSETTAKPSGPAFQTTGGSYYVVPASPIVSAEEQEWTSLLASERKGLAKRRIKPRAVDKATREVRYGK